MESGQSIWFKVVIPDVQVAEDGQMRESWLAIQLNIAPRLRRQRGSLGDPELISSAELRIVDEASG